MAEKKGLTALKFGFISIVLMIVSSSVIGLVLLYVVNRDTFTEGITASETYTGNAEFDPSLGIVVQEEAEDGTINTVKVEDVFEELDGAETYLKDDEESTKEEKLQYLLNAELVTQFPYMQELEGDESKLNGKIKIYRYTDEIEAEEGQTEENEENAGEINFNPKEVFYIGDSWMEGLHTYISTKESSEYGGRNHFIFHQGLNASAPEFSTETLKEKIDAVNSEISSIVIMLGLNGPSTRTASAMEKIIEFLTFNYSEKTIYVLKVPHVGEEYKSGNTDAIKLNSAIDEYNGIVLRKCSGIANAKFIDTTSNMMTEELFLHPDYKSGEYHLNEDGKALWYSNIKECIKEGKSSIDVSKFQMIYLKEDEFENKLKEYEESGNTEIYKYFTINEENQAVVAYGRKINKTITTNDPENTLEAINSQTGEIYQEVEEGVYASTKYIVSTKSFEINTLVSAYTMPFNVLWAFLVETKDYDMVKDIADLVYDSQISIAIYDNESVSTSNTFQKYNKHLRYTENTTLIFPAAGETSPSFNINTYRYNNVIKSCTGSIVDGEAVHNAFMTEEIQETREGNLYEYYISGITGEGEITELQSDEYEYTKTTNTVIVAKETPTIGVVLADVWIGRWEATYKVEDDSDSQSTGAVTNTEGHYEQLDTSKISPTLLSGQGIIAQTLNSHSREIRAEAIEKIMENTSFNRTVTVTFTNLYRHIFREKCSTCENHILTAYGKTLEEILEESEDTNVTNAILADKEYRGDDGASNARRNAFRHAQQTLNTQATNDLKGTFRESLNNKVRYTQSPTAEKATINMTVSTNTTRTGTKYEKDEVTCENEGEKFKEILTRPEYYKSKTAILERTEWFWEYIRQAEDSAKLEDVLRYLFNIAFETDKFGYFDEDDIEELFKMFEPKEWTRLDGIYGNTIEEKVWFTLREAGYSENAVAGVMGNVWAESGFKTNNLENSFEKLLGYTDESYTEAVNMGIYTREQFISDHTANNCGAGYGLAQWTWYTLKAGLYDFAQSRGVSIDNEDLQVEYLLGGISYSGGADGYAKCSLSDYNGYTVDDWINANSPESAAAAFCWVYEKPAGTDTTKREEQARKYYEQFQGLTRSNSGSQAILKAAQEVHDEQIDWVYYSEHSTGPESLKEDIESSINNPDKTTSCSTYVASVLYTAGLFSEDEMNSFDYQTPQGISEELKRIKWEKITDSSQWMPGDIVFLDKSDTRGIDHVQIYAGDNKWYNACSTKAIQSSAPCNNNWKSTFDNSYAYRPPARAGSGWYDTETKVDSAAIGQYHSSYGRVFTEWRQRSRPIWYIRNV